MAMSEMPIINESDALSRELLWDKLPGVCTMHTGIGHCLEVEGDGE